jgi:eukaryotic-like serine/threonine-protein kinase
MGEVYEAEDTELATRVALKTIRPHIAGDGQAVDRFKREILLARRVTHPNVCRIFDVSQHQPDPVEGEAFAAGPVTFLTMELLEGETLSARLRRAGPLPHAEAEPIAVQMAGALAAAHRAGVVHRDVKCGNVILVRAEDDSVRAVITDFGLAREDVSRDEGAAEMSSSTGAMVGTAAYMSPEQVIGGRITAAADIYAFGVVLYEMVTGVKPFGGDSALSTAIRRLRERPQSPRTLAPDLPQRWERAILRCLERDPEARFATAEDVARALGPSGGRARSVWPWLAALVLAVAVGAVGRARFGGVTRDPSPSAPPPAPQAAPRRSIAVLGFKDLASRPEDAWLSTALSEMLSTELGAGDRLRTIPGEKVVLMKRDLQLADADTLGLETLARIRSRLGADLVVLGSYALMGPARDRKVRLDLKLQDAQAGETLTTVAEAGPEASLFDLVSRVGARLRAHLAVGDLSSAEAGALRHAMPTSPEGVRAYAEGLERLRQLDAVAARASLEKSIAADAAYPLAHSALAEAWSALGYDTRAAEEARRAFELSGGLSRRERLQVEARHLEAQTAWARAVEVYRVLWGFFPDDIEYGLRLAAAETAAGQPKAALATIARLRDAGVPGIAADPRLDLEESDANAALSNFKDARAAAVRAAENGLSQGARLLVAKARLREGWAALQTDDYAAADAAFADGRDIFAAAGDRSSAAWALRNIGMARGGRGDASGAQHAFEEALGVFQEVGNRRGVAAILNHLGQLRGERGDWAEARKHYQRSLDAFREIGDRNGAARLLGNLALAAYGEGHLEQATRLFEESLALHREVGDEMGAAFILDNSADVLLERGDLARALSAAEEAGGIYERLGKPSGLASSVQAQGEVLLMRGDLVGARRRHDEALAIRDKLGDTTGVAQSRLGLARLARAEDRTGDAEALARDAAEAFRGQEQAENEAVARALQARALAEQGRAAEAAKAVESAVRLSAGNGGTRLRLVVDLAQARTQAAGGADRAVSRADAVAARARQAGHAQLELEARLVAAEIEILAGQRAAARGRLTRLEADARALGFELFASQSRRLATAPEPSARPASAPR